MKIFLIDIDGTCCEDIMNEDSHLYPTAKVIEGSLEQINKWYDEGNHITFFTARKVYDVVEVTRIPFSPSRYDDYSGPIYKIINDKGELSGYSDECVRVLTLDEIRELKLNSI